MNDRTNSLLNVVSNVFNAVDLVLMELHLPELLISLVVFESVDLLNDAPDVMVG
jgi:hypothetical protein